MVLRRIKDGSRMIRDGGGEKRWVSLTSVWSLVQGFVDEQCAYVEISGEILRLRICLNLTFSLVRGTL